MARDVTHKRVDIQLAEKIVKVKRLRDGTDVPGERAAADVRLRALCAKHGLTEKMVDNIEVEWKRMEAGPVRIHTDSGPAIRYPDGRIVLIRPRAPVMGIRIVTGGSWTSASTDTSTASVHWW